MILLKRIGVLGSVLVLFMAYNLKAQKNVSVGKSAVNSGKVKLTGVIKDISTGERLIGATVFVQSLGEGVSTGINGNYEIELIPDDYIIQFSMIGYNSINYNVALLGAGEINVKLLESATQLNEIQITGQSPDHNVKSNDIGKQVLSVESIQELPSFVGEVDVLKSLTLLPGVSTVGEASSGFNIRGGSSDQNLILLGGAPLYNPSHLFGFFSAFNADAISRVSLYKSGVPTKYGGRASSVIDIQYKNGNHNNWKGNVSIGTISAKMLIEGPIVKNKLSLLVTGRTSYSDWILKTVNDPVVRNSSAYFFDTNGRLNFIANDKNKVAYTFYLSGDEFAFASDTTLSWSNQNHIVDWNYFNGSKLSTQFSIIHSKYENVIENNSGINDFDLKSSILNTGAKFDVDYTFSKKGNLNLGVQSNYIVIDPGTMKFADYSDDLKDENVDQERALESSLYVDFSYEVGNKLGITFGARYNLYNYLGPGIQYEYESYTPKSIDSIVDSTAFDAGEPIVSYYGLEPRATIRYSLSSSSSIKAAYSKMYQYIHLISNTSAIAPTDIWKLSDPHIKPQEVDQYSIGYFKNFKENSFESSVEVYYKSSHSLPDYKDGADLILNENIETELLSGKGEAYGVEVFFKKITGRFTGWGSYTYSRSLMKVVGPYDIEEINNGDWYSSNFDKPHNFTTVLMYKINDLWSISGNFTYSTGRPVTYPSAKIEVEGKSFAYFDERNGSRIPDYHRLDFSVTYKVPSRKRIWGGDWKFSVYNLYGRKNAFSVFFQDQDGSPPQPYKLSVLGVPFPSLSYNFKF